MSEIEVTDEIKKLFMESFDEQDLNSTLREKHGLKSRDIEKLKESIRGTKK